MRTPSLLKETSISLIKVGMKPLSERDENGNGTYHCTYVSGGYVGMKPLSERDENI